VELTQSTLHANALAYSSDETRRREVYVQSFVDSRPAQGQPPQRG